MVKLAFAPAATTWEFGLAETEKFVLPPLLVVVLPRLGEITQPAKERNNSRHSHMVHLRNMSFILEHLGPNQRPSYNSGVQQQRSLPGWLHGIWPVRWYLCVRLCSSPFYSFHPGLWARSALLMSWWTCATVIWALTLKP